ncbi:MAG: efflux RND transporter permease subunit [Gammaproteobacteria bacterium]|nr:efflux RND transporter permease subunit [Gammaproteobacteria bacterium]
MPSTQPLVLSHFNRMYAEHIMARLAPGYSMGQAVNEINRIAKETLPSTVQYRWFGQTRNYLQSQSNMMDNFVLALIFIYLILAAQFGSFIQPIIILLSVPASIFGALLTLKLTHNSINIFSDIGIITLIGLITKHGILITSFANQLREEGMEQYQAIIHASGMRLRPIIMTTAAMVLGAMPLVLHGGPGAESRAQIGWVIVGGLTFGTLCTLFIVPVIYTLLQRRIPVKSEQDAS